MAFDGYTVFVDSVFDASKHDVLDTCEYSVVSAYIENVMQQYKPGCVVSVFENDTENDSKMIEWHFFDPINGWNGWASWDV